MQKITLYRYTRPDGGVTVSPVPPAAGVEYAEEYRLVADEGKTLTNGETSAACVDTANPSAWEEIDDPGEMTEVEEKAMAYDILTGVRE